MEKTYTYKELKAALIEMMLNDDDWLDFTFSEYCDYTLLDFYNVLGDPNQIKRMKEELDDFLEDCARNDAENQIANELDVNLGEAEKENPTFEVDLDDWNVMA